MNGSEKSLAMLIRKIFLIFFDITVVFISSCLAILIRFDFSIKYLSDYIGLILKFYPANIVITILVFFAFHLYNSLWTFAGVIEMQNITITCMITAFLQYIGMELLSFNIPRSYYVLYFLCFTVSIMASRFIYRFIRQLKRKMNLNNYGINTMIIGGGKAGNLLINEILNTDKIGLNIKCIIDDDLDKKDRFINGIKIVGGKDSIIENVKKYDIKKIIIAIPSASRDTIKSIIKICKETNCELKTLPGLYQLINGDVNVSRLRNIEIEDLLGREPIKVDLKLLMGYVKNKVVLVTGGGGSIGSELCRQIASYKPKQLIIVDIYENNAYFIEQELRNKYSNLNLEVLIASVREEARLDSIFSKYKPDIVYHAAAHKHVPLMENSPAEAIKNNVFGTLNTVKMADKYNVNKFVLISTDKAVNPTNIMGASKRLCEMIVQSYNKLSQTDYVAVRFGNVLGSNGSVIPVFKKQIEAGGPVKVTHPDITRYFMTIPEAVSLVLQAGALARGGEIFVLDMGEEVKILDLAKNLIKLSGYIPDKDIKIEFTGLRPGEKLYEELLMDEEGLQTTQNELIKIGKPIDIDIDHFFKELDRLKYFAYNENENIKYIVKELVPTYILEQKEEKVIKQFEEKINKKIALIESDTNNTKLVLSTT